MASSGISTLASTLGIFFPLALIAFGVFTAQVYFYLLEYDDDPAWLKTYVSIIWVLECISSAFCLHMIYTSLVTDFGNPSLADEIIWSVWVITSLLVIVVALIQGFNIYRAWKFSHCWTVLVIPGIVLLCRLVFSILSVVVGSRSTDWSTFRDTKGVTYAFNSSFALGIVVDILVVSFLTYELLKAKSHAQYHVHYIQKIVNWVVYSGALTVVFSVAVTITFNVMSHTLVFGGLYVLGDKLYANTMLANLNARKHIRDNSAALVRVYGNSLEVSPASHQHAVEVAGQMVKPTEIMKTTEVLTTTDEADQDYHVENKVMFV